MCISKSQAWRNLEHHADEMDDFHLRDAFARDTNRFKKYTVQFGDLLFDYSKQRITDSTLEKLLALVKESNLEAWRDRLFTGERINHTEQRAVLHTALRDISPDPLMLDGENIKIKINAVLEKMECFVDQIHSGERRGYTGKKIDTVVNIGIGGSDLGPKMLYNG